MSRTGPTPEVAPASPRRATVIGAGLVGCMAALRLAQRGYLIQVFESRPDPRKLRSGDGRSVHLVVSARGFRALEAIGVDQAVRELSMPLRGRIVHAGAGAPSFHAYGQEDQAIFAVTRAALNEILIQRAAAHERITISFGQKCTAVDLDGPLIHLERADSGQRSAVQADRIVAADGGFSKVRSSLLRQEGFDHAQSYSSYAYKELFIPQATSGGFPLDPSAMHVWPRGRRMITAFPNRDHSFTAMLLLPREGERSFAELQTDEDVLELFRSLFPDALPLMPGLASDFFSRAPSSFITMRCYPWAHGKLLLIGDAAHAMVPFLGQGMNAGFEDCTLLADCLERHDDEWERALLELQRIRKPDCDAVTDLSEEHLVELTERVGTAQFLLRKRIEQRLQRMFPERFIPLYAMVAFTHIPYSECRRRAKAQEAMVEELMRVEDIEQRWEDPESQALVHRLAGGLAP